MLSRRIKILEAASRIITENGINKFTLEMVANEANISKGGLLYHFPSKDELITKMNVYALERFIENIKREEEKITEGKGKFIRAYAKATINELSENPLLNSSLLASLANNMDVLNAWRDQYEKWEKAFIEENVKREDALTIRLVCDGLWFSNMFDLNVMDKEEAVSLLSYLLGRLEEG